jgi:hypothetical protein
VYPFFRLFFVDVVSLDGAPHTRARRSTHAVPFGDDTLERIAFVSFVRRVRRRNVATSRRTPTTRTRAAVCFLNRSHDDDAIRVDARA